MVHKSLRLALVSVSFAASGPWALAASASDTKSCSKISDDRARLACYDNLFGHGADPVGIDAGAKPAAPTPVPQAAGAAPVYSAERMRDDFGLTETAKREREPNKAVVSVESIQGRVASVGRRTTGEFVVTLDNGQVWAQIESDAKATIRPGDIVTVRKASLGSFMMVSPTRVATRVKRIK